MNKENTLKLFNDFPQLYQGKDLPRTENLMSFGFECGDGWFEIIYNLSKTLSEKDPNCIAVQVKEKFGGLRFYTNGNNLEGEKAIEKAEEKSDHTCEYCGDIETAKKRGGGWIKTLCDNCYSEEESIVAILEDLASIKKELQEEIGDFDVVTNNQNDALLIKNWQGVYFTITHNKNTNRIVVEDVHWIAEGIRSRKKKQKYINNVDLKRGK